jgi:hypothetical protein
MFWTSAFAGVTTQETFYETIKFRVTVSGSRREVRGTRKKKR